MSAWAKYWSFFKGIRDKYIVVSSYNLYESFKPNEKTRGKETESAYTIEQYSQSNNPLVQDE